MKRTKLGIAISVVLLGITTPTLAQENEAEQQTEKQAESKGIEVIEVTAQKRVQNSQEVPIAMTAVSAADMERMGATEIKDIQFSTPNLTITGGNPNQQSYGIRGISDRSRNPGYDQRLGVYVDGVWVGKGAASNQSALDIESVEVLRGPQGTLFGKNTVAGAININTKRPYDELGGTLSVDAGNYNYTNITGSINIPIAENVAAKFSVNKIDRDGYIDNLFEQAKYKDFNNLDSMAARAQLLWNVSDATEVYITADHFQSDFRNVGSEQTPEADPFAPKPYEVSLNTANNFEVEGVGGVSVTVDHTFENDFNLTSISAYRYEKSNYDDVDQDFLPLDIATSYLDDDSKHFSQELRLASPDEGDFNYLVGLYYLKQDIDGLGGSSLMSAFFVDWNAEVNNQSWAAFFHTNYDLTETLQLTAGVRYTQETKEIDYFQKDSTGFFLSPQTGLEVSESFADDRKATDVSPKISLNWFINDDTMLYGGYSKAYKSGGYNADWIVTTEGIEFDDEQVDAYELGIKSTLFDNSLRLNAALFYSDNSDYQVQAMTPLASGGSILTITNAGELTSQGVELDFQYIATDWLRAWGSFGYTDVEFDKFEGCTRGGLANQDCSGNRPAEAPKLNYNLGAESFFEVGSGEIFANLQYFWRDEMYSNPSNDLNTLNESYGELSGRVGWRSNSNAWSVSLWAKNLTGEEKQIFNVPSFLQADTAVYNVPRTYGLSLKWNFGS
ncbi:TonB-dependent receptor [Shewanella aestuarii]|uniref:TonB-dependent receptor n=1 Tax=Shewanella aestuarii TaxID=1028752 RepID=A0A6G9QMK1_9GAMM|nr:TonB-dependent receptor [Shewanella aestuarii]QIR15820.1 TonB-dependent receptor [Shewanella aestuarii]